MDEALARRAVQRDLQEGNPQGWEPDPWGRPRRQRSGRDDDAPDRSWRRAEFRESAGRGSFRRAGAEESESAWGERRPPERGPERGFDRGSDRDALERDPERGYERGGSARGYDRAGERGGDALEQTLERWVSRGRELVDGVAGTRPGSRPADRRGGGAAMRRGSQAAQGNGGLGAGGLNPARLGRWVEERIDWFLDEDREDDWREPWQERDERPQAPPLGAERQDRLARRAQPPPSPPQPRAFKAEAAAPSAPARGRLEPEPGRPSWPGAERRGLEAISRRAARPTASDQSPPRSGSLPQTPPAEPNEAELDEAWPDEESFSVPRWSRPGRDAAEGPAARLEAPSVAGPATAPSPAATPAASPVPAPAPGRALPRSTRRR